ncbi:MAG: site-specific integrase [Clostridia bacterium]
MAYFKITQNRKGELVAKIQASGKDITTGENKLFVKRVYNTDNLTEAKFKKAVNKLAIEFEQEVADAYRDNTTILRTKVLTFAELMTEWKANIKANLSLSYYFRAEDVEIKFQKYLEEQHLADKPLSEIKVRDVQLFLGSFANNKYKISSSVKLIKQLPQGVNFRELARLKILSRNASYYMKQGKCNITKEKAEAVCEMYGLQIGEYFEINDNEKQYSTETIKGYRRILRTLFNEAVRYEWITKNPVCGTKVAAGSSNTSLRPVPEKEVFSFKEAKDLIDALSNLPEEYINKEICVKLMLMTGIRSAELHGLRWSDIDFENHILHVRRNRLYAKEYGYYEKPPKTKTSLRDIPLSETIIKDLKRYYAWFKIADDHFDEKLDSYYIAVNDCREPENAWSTGQWLGRFEETHGFKHVSCHGLRHTYCSLLLSQNVPIQTVSKYMGHSDSTVTLKVYSHFIPDTQNRVLDVLDSLTN